MRRMKHLMGFALILIGFNATFCKAETSYSLEYASNSPIKSVPLNNASLKLEIYAYDNPHGYIHVKTDENKQFSLGHSHNFAVLEITGEAKYHARCSGYATYKNEKIKITCSPR